MSPDFLDGELAQMPYCEAVPAEQAAGLWMSLSSAGPIWRSYRTKQCLSYVTLIILCSERPDLLSAPAYLHFCH